jgi:hypothetical protein
VARLIFSFDLGRRRSRWSPLFFSTCHGAAAAAAAAPPVRVVRVLCWKASISANGDAPKGEGRAARRVCVCPPRRTESLIPFINAVRDRNSDIPSRFLVSLRASCEFYKKRNKRRRDLDWLLLYFRVSLSHTQHTHTHSLSLLHFIWYWWSAEWVSQLLRRQYNKRRLLSFITHWPAPAKFDLFTF